MDIKIPSSFLPHFDPEASLAFYRDALGFEVRKDVGYQDMRWITVGPASQPDVSQHRTVVQTILHSAGASCNGVSTC